MSNKTKEIAQAKQNNVLIVEDDRDLREALLETVELAGHNGFTAENGKAAISMLEKANPSIIVSDVQMKEMDGFQLLQYLQKRLPEVPVIMITAHSNVNDAVCTMRSGASDYIAKPFEPNILLEKIAKYCPCGVTATNEPVAEDPKSKQLLTLARRVARTDATVMISGESGTGKEVLARYIHDYSPRSDKPFIAINCAAIPENMLEATLFGYEKGAFTGAYKAMPGKFEQAQGGTLLLDEISEMDLALQAKLLRVLQEKEVERIGGKDIIKLDVRVLATSNRDMKKEAEQGSFREDLYYRLNVFPLHWYPLRQRPMDIVPLAQYLLQQHVKANGGNMPSYSEAAVKALQTYDWPGNAREMDNVVQRALILQTGETIEVEDLHLDMVPLKEDPAPEEIKDEATKNKKKQEYDAIYHELTARNGDRNEVAKLMNVSMRSLRYKISRMREMGYEV